MVPAMNNMPTEKLWGVMFLFPFFIGIHQVQCAREYSQRSYQPPNTTFMDVFMALFMVCTFEVILVKILTSDDNGQEENRQRSANIFFDPWTCVVFKMEVFYFLVFIFVTYAMEMVFLKCTGFDEIVDKKSNSAFADVQTIDNSWFSIEDWCDFVNINFWNIRIVRICVAIFWLCRSIHV